MSKQPITVDYHGQQLTAIDRKGQPWFTADTLGRCLGYNDSNYRKATLNLYNRHSDEFSEADTFVINLMTKSRGNPSTRIFSLSGAIKLATFASTSFGKQFRQWAWAELEARMLNSNSSAAPAALQAELLRARPKWQTIARCKEAGLNHVQTGRVIGCNSETVRRHVRRMETLGILTPPTELSRLQAMTANFGYLSA